MIAAGLFAQWMLIQFIGLRLRDACNPKQGGRDTFPGVRISGCSVEPRCMA